MINRLLSATAIILASAPVAPAAQAATACPAKDFSAFVTAFADDVAIQRAFTADPLFSESIDPAAEPEPAPVTERLAGAARAFPVMPSAAQQRRDGLQLTVSNGVDGDHVVTLRKPDTDAQVRYLFRKAGTCWQLYRRADDSL
ncbi:hypothetical protein [Sphingomonas sanxanigenens]|uniref:DUF4440 domain-containing protein n=1 Tax=Sphingomonas sanxanigenens DSM 19645 = NX02 TaxID=1123269 RepID=W0ADZ3_9SPHN|nr:hypothetical protein [Sphingomonas sanxanigenens]AHE54767.1 hypothetical protein NX02_15420 [Sphingomonas sanxanigenens DSM 19645 = NX02]